jgi:hypothetical protein
MRLKLSRQRTRQQRQVAGTRVIRNLPTVWVTKNVTTGALARLLGCSDRYHNEAGCNRWFYGGPESKRIKPIWGALWDRCSTQSWVGRRLSLQGWFRRLRRFEIVPYVIMETNEIFPHPLSVQTFRPGHERTRKVRRPIGGLHSPAIQKPWAHS